MVCPRPADVAESAVAEKLAKAATAKVKTTRTCEPVAYRARSSPYEPPAMHQVSQRSACSHTGLPAAVWLVDLPRQSLNDWNQLGPAVTRFASAE